MKLYELSPAEGSTKENFRKGRGAGSGNGKTAGKGHISQFALHFFYSKKIFKSFEHS